MAYSGSQITRLGLSATPRGLTGNFAGKTAALPVTGPKKHEGLRRNVGKMMR